jgi:spore coat protein CotH
MMQQKTKLVEKFDKDGDKRLNAAERKAALEYLQSQGGGGGRRGPRFGSRGGEQTPKPGRKLTPADVNAYPNAPLYDPLTLRTLFLEFEDANWEKELAAFKYTDVDVPAKLVVDGKTYLDVGVHFRGMSSFMMVGEEQKRSLNLSLDFVHKDQQIGGYRTLELLNSHEDPTFLRSVLSLQIAREYMPAPKANYVRVVINGESWGIYVNAQQFNKDFVQDWFNTKKGARWKVPGSPGGRGSLAYLGEDASAYKQIYSIRTKDDPKSWADLIRLCRVLNETPAGQLQAALRPLLDVDGALKFLALENTLINNDGYWIRTSDYNIYEDTSGRFHIIPHDMNENFSVPEGPGGPGGPGGRGGRRGPGGGGFGPGMMLGHEMFYQADKNGDEKVSKPEFIALAESWFDKLDTNKTGKLTATEFADGFSAILPPPSEFGAGPGPGASGPGPGRGRGGFGPARFIAPALFTATDSNKDGTLTRSEFTTAFADWYVKWDSSKAGSISEQQLAEGLNTVLPAPDFAGRGGRFGGGPSPKGRMRVEGVKLDPLVDANDSSKPLLSKLLAVPELKAQYLGYVREMAERWLDWNKLGPIAQEYYALIADDVRADTRKLDSTQGFLAGLTAQPTGGFGGAGSIGIKTFADQRRTYLLSYPEIQKLPR